MSRPLPSSPTEWDRWIVDQRRGIPRDPGLHPLRAGGWCVEGEVSPDGVEEPGLTVFLTNRECPWKCLMCDLWRHTLEESVLPGAIPTQISGVFAAVGDLSRFRWIKLYNAGSFFDRRAIPESDYPAIAALCRPFDRVIVECHPALAGARIAGFRGLLREGSRLEVALGLETVHPVVLPRLNKGVTCDGFSRAVRTLKAARCDVRAFILIKPPFLTESEALEWGCRSVDFAFDCGVDVVALIPTRFGNGALDALATSGDFAPPLIATLESVMAHALRVRRGRAFADLWDLEKFVFPGPGFEATRDRLEQMNRRQWRFLQD